MYFSIRIFSLKKMAEQLGLYHMYFAQFALFYFMMGFYSIDFDTVRIFYDFYFESY